MPVDIGGTIALLNAGASTLRVARDLAKRLEQREILEHLVNAMDSVADARLQLADAKDEIATLRGRITELEAAAQRREALVFSPAAGVWFRAVDGKEDRSVAHCPKCWSKDERQVPMSEGDFYSTPTWYCPACDYQRSISQ